MLLFIFLILNAKSIFFIEMTSENFCKLFKFSGGRGECLSSSNPAGDSLDAGQVAWETSA